MPHTIKNAAQSRSQEESHARNSAPEYNMPKLDGFLPLKRGAFHQYAKASFIAHPPHTPRR
jgi:hypothetical protein